MNTDGNQENLAELASDEASDEPSCEENFVMVSPKCSEVEGVVEEGKEEKSELDEKLEVDGIKDESCPPATESLGSGPSEGNKEEKKEEEKKEEGGEEDIESKIFIRIHTWNQKQFILSLDPVATLRSILPLVQRKLLLQVPLTAERVRICKKTEERDVLMGWEGAAGVSLEWETKIKDLNSEEVM